LINFIHYIIWNFFIYKIFIFGVFYTDFWICVTNCGSYFNIRIYLKKFENFKFIWIIMQYLHNFENLNENFHMRLSYGLYQKNYVSNNKSIFCSVFKLFFFLILFYIFIYLRKFVHTYILFNRVYTILIIFRRVGTNIYVPGFYCVGIYIICPYRNLLFPGYSTT